MEKIDIKNKNFFKNKWQMVIYIIIFAILIYLFIVIGTKDYSSDVPDNERFANQYSLVGIDNVYKYVNVLDAHMIAGGKDGIVLFGVSNNDWVEYYANIVNEAAKAMGIDTIYYYDIARDREQNNATYEDTIKLLSEFVIYNDLNKSDLYAPTLLIVKDGKVILFDTDTCFVRGNITPSKYWDEYRRELKMEELKVAFRTYLGN